MSNDDIDLMPIEYQGAEISEHLAGHMRGKRWVALLLIGPPGTGKTHQIYALVRKHGWGKIKVISECMEIDRHRFDWDCIDQIIGDRRLLCLDDIGYLGSDTTVWARQALYAILTGRLQRGLKTIMTTNLTQEQLIDAYGPAVASRALCGEVVTTGGDDRRKDKAWGPRQPTTVNDLS